jgi:hypothetical protein
MRHFPPTRVVGSAPLRRRSRRSTISRKKKRQRPQRFSKNNHPPSTIETFRTSAVWQPLGPTFPPRSPIDAQVTAASLREKEKSRKEKERKSNWWHFRVHLPGFHPTRQSGHSASVDRARSAVSEQACFGQRLGGRKLLRWSSATSDTPHTTWDGLRVVVAKAPTPKTQGAGSNFLDGQKPLWMISKFQNTPGGLG